MRRLWALAAGVVLVAVLSVVADLAIPAAGSQTPTTLYVDPRIGDDQDDGLLPNHALATLTEALRRTQDDGSPGATVLLMGYDYQLVHQGTGHHCLTVRGTADHPVVIRPNVYTNTLYPVVVTTRTPVTTRWRLVDRGGGLRTWTTPWDPPVRLTKVPSHGLLQVGQIGIDGYDAEPPASVGNATWWTESGGSGRLYVRTDNPNPNDYKVSVKDGDGICLSGRSRHVRIRGLVVDGAVHAVRAEPGARDIRVRNIARRNVLDEDVLPPSAR